VCVCVCVCVCLCACVPVCKSVCLCVTHSSRGAARAVDGALQRTEAKCGPNRTAALPPPLDTGAQPPRHSAGDLYCRRLVTHWPAAAAAAAAASSAGMCSDQVRWVAEPEPEGSAQAEEESVLSLLPPPLDDVAAREQAADERERNRERHRETERGQAASERGLLLPTAGAADAMSTRTAPRGGKVAI
jgi:hypothetical protein